MQIAQCFVGCREISENYGITKKGKDTKPDTI